MEFAVIGVLSLKVIFAFDIGSAVIKNLKDNDYCNE